MSLFHATYAERIEAILRDGLIPSPLDRNFPEARPGVYLSTDPVLPLGVLIEHVMMNTERFISPSDAVKRFRVIVIDGSRLDDRLLVPDPQIDPDANGNFWLYPQRIDVRCMPILTLDQLGMG